jgi:hypothetical protein
MKAYFRRLLPMTLIAFCFFVVVILLSSDRLSMLTSGAVPWWKTSLLLVTFLVLSFAAAALIDWDERRKARKASSQSDAIDFDYASTAVAPGALFVAADEPLLVYPSVGAAERDLEAIDVENGVYTAAYGPNGEPYRIRNEGKPGNHRTDRRAE